MRNHDHRVARRDVTQKRPTTARERNIGALDGASLAFQGVREPPHAQGEQAPDATRAPATPTLPSETQRPAPATTQPPTTPRQATWRQRLATFRMLEGDPRASNRILIVVWLVTRVLLTLSVVVGHAYTDPQFYHYAGQLAVGQFPYRDIPVEYPPLAMILILAPALPLLLFPGIAPRPDAAFLHVSHLPHPLDPVRYGAYAIAFAVEMLIVDAVTLWLVRRAARRLAPGDANGLRAGLFYLALTFASGALLQKFDLIVGTLCLGAALALVERRRGLAWSLLAAATLVKGFPLLVVPVFALYEFERAAAGVRPYRLLGVLRAAWRPIAVGLAWFVGVLLAVGLAVSLFGGPGSLVHAVASQTGRNFEIESLYANVMLALGWLPGLAVGTTFRPAVLSRIVLSPLAPMLAPFVMAILIVAAVAVYALLARGALLRARRPVTPRADASAPGASVPASPADSGAANTGAPDNATAARALLVGTTLITLTFLLAYPALPAHYLLAILPLAPLLWLGTPRRNWLWLSAVAAVALLGQIVTINAIWQSIVALRPWAIGALSLRNIAWLVAFGALVAAAWAFTPRAPGVRSGPPSASPDETALAAGAHTEANAPAHGAPRSVGAPHSGSAMRVGTTATHTPSWRLGRLRRRVRLAWRRLARSAPPIPGFTPRGEDVFAHLLSQVSPLRLILVAGASSAIMYLGFVLAFPIVIFYNQPHVGRESSVINDMGAITGYSPLAAIAFVSAVITLIACQFMALLATTRVVQRSSVEAELAEERAAADTRARQLERRVRWAALGFPMLFSAIMIWMQPVTTTDLYGYVARGYLYAHLGQNPLVTAAYQLPGGLSVDRPPAPYGPLWIMITWVVSKLSGENLLANMLVFKLIGAVGVALSLLLVDRLAKRFYPDRRLRVDVLFGWSPLLIFEAVGNGHNDIIMMLCVLVAIALMLRGRAQLAFAFIVIGALIKYVSAVLAPLWLVYELRHLVRERAEKRLRVVGQANPTISSGAHTPPIGVRGAPDRLADSPAEAIGDGADETTSEGFADAARRIARDTVRAAGEIDRKAALKLIGGATVIGGALTIICYAPFWVGLHTFTGLGAQLRPLYYNDSLAAFVSGPLQLLVPTSKLAALDKTVRLVFYSLLAIYVAIQTHQLWTLGPRADLRDFITASAKVIFAALVLITFWFQPWYVVWLLPLAPLAREPFVRRQATIFAAGALLTYAIGAYLLVDEAATTLGQLTVQFFEILVTFGPLLLLRTAPSEGGWGRRVRRYLGLLGEGVNQRPLFWERVMLGMVLIVAVLLRLLGLGALTAQLPTDASQVDALKAVSADLRLFLTDPQGLHGPFVAAQGLLVRILGPTPLAALLPSAVIGALTVVAIYLLAVEIMRQERLPGQRVVGILAALLAATSQWHISLSRSGMEVVLLPLLMCLTVYCLLLAFRLRMEAVDATRSLAATGATNSHVASTAIGVGAPRRAPRRRLRRMLAGALRRSRTLRGLYRVTLLPLARQARQGARGAAHTDDARSAASADDAQQTTPTATRDRWPTILALNVACGVCAGLIFDLAPGLWLSPLLVIGFLVIWRWRQPQIFSRVWLGLATLIGGTLIASLPALWLFVNQQIGFPVGGPYLARSSVGQASGPGVFSALFWQRVLANVGNAFSLVTSQNYSAAYPAAGNAPIIPAVLGPFFLIGLLILLYRWRSLTSLAALLLVAAPLLASVAISAPTSVIEAASVLPAMCIVPAIALYQIGAFLGSLPIVLDRLHGVRVFTTPEQIGRLALLVFLLVSTIRTFFWLFEATLPTQPGTGLPSYIGPALALAHALAHGAVALTTGTPGA